MGDQIEPPSEVLEVVLEAGKEAQLRGGKASLMGRYRQDGKRNGKPKYTIVDGSGQSNGAFLHWEDGSRSGKGKFWGITGNDEATQGQCPKCCRLIRIRAFTWVETTKILHVWHMFICLDLVCAYVWSYAFPRKCCSACAVTDKILRTD